MSTKSNNFKIGLFVLSAFGILVVAIVVFGAGELVQNPVTVEIYLDQSVQGLEVGSPVKFRGVQIGRVESINFTHNRYQQDMDIARRKRWVLVEVALFPQAFRDRTDVQIREYLDGEIKRGMRVRLVTGGLTGLAYLETDFYDPKLYPPMEVPWTPQNHYVPSVPSPNIGRIGDSVSRIVRQLEKVEFGSIAANLDQLTRTTTRAVDEAQVGTLRREGLALLAEMRQSNRQLKEMLDHKDWEAIRADAAATFRKTRRMADRVDAKIDRLLASLQDTADNSNRAAERLRALLESDAVRSSLANLDAAARDMPFATTQLKKMLRRVDRLLMTQQQEVQEIVANIRLISANVLDLTATVKKYPSRILFGEPPALREKPRK